MLKSLPRDLVSTVAAFVEANLPWEGETDWLHDHDAACIGGCELLDALGYAHQTEWGAIPIDPPVMRSTLPRWDDTCVALLYLAERSWVFGLGLHPTIARMPLHGDPFNRGYCAEPAFVELLEKLGLMAGDRWTSAAEAVLWRHLPFLDPMPAFDAEPRLVELAHQSIETVPADVLEHIMSIPEHDTPFVRRLRVEEILARRWRYPEGWLDAYPAGTRTVHVIQDPLAAWMSRWLVESG